MVYTVRRNHRDMALTIDKSRMHTSKELHASCIDLNYITTFTFIAAFPKVYKQHEQSLQLESRIIGGAAHVF